MLCIRTILLILLSVSVLTASKCSVEENTESSNRPLNKPANKPLRQFYFRNTEESLRLLESDDWIAKWDDFEGIILKVLGEENLPFPQKSLHTLIQYKQQYPLKKLLLHFNGRARNPLYNPQTLSSSDYLYFLGTTSQEDINHIEDISYIKVVDINVFKKKPSLTSDVNEDIVIVKKQANGDLDWTITEHATLLEINEGNGTIKVKRDLLKSGKLNLDSGQAYIAQHVAKGPSHPLNKQRLWEYNWAYLSKGSASGDDLSYKLAQELADVLLLTHAFFDGITIDVLTETHHSKIGGYPMKLDIDNDGQFDPAEFNYDILHSKGIYEFLSHLRNEIGITKLILADGTYIHQRGVGLLNGIESEGWPTLSDPFLVHWSSGLNRHRYWSEFSSSPNFNYMKIGDYYYTLKKKFLPPRNNIRRLAVAAAVLTDSIVVPAHKPDGLPFNEWPEFKQIDNLGAALTETVVVETGRKVNVLANQSARLKEINDIKPLSFNLKTKAPDFGYCFDTPNSFGEKTIIVSATTQSNSDLPLFRPQILYAKYSNSDARYSFVGTESFSSWFYWPDAKGDELCFSTESDSHLHIEKLTIMDGPLILARIYEKGALFANPSFAKIELPEKWLTDFAGQINNQAIAGRGLTLKDRNYTILKY